VSIAVTVDIAAFAVVDGSLEVLLVERKHPPFQGMGALPGGFVDAGESLAGAARRELLEETGVTADRLHQFGAYGDPGRDPRGHTVSVAFWTVVTDPERIEAGDDAATAQLTGVSEAVMAPLAFDHDSLLRDGLTALAAAVGYDQGKSGYEAEVTALGGRPTALEIVRAALQPSS
jgi:8-oxo-dGTP diphosphatase